MSEVRVTLEPAAESAEIVELIDGLRARWDLPIAQVAAVAGVSYQCLATYYNGSQTRRWMRLTLIGATGLMQRVDGDTRRLTMRPDQKTARETRALITTIQITHGASFEQVAEWLGWGPRTLHRYFMGDRVKRRTWLALVGLAGVLAAGGGEG